MLNKAYVRFRESLPDSANTFAAADGFSTLGIPVVPFYGFDDINVVNMPDVGPDTIFCGFLGDVWKALELMGRPKPMPVDYPDHLHWMMGRDFSFVTLEHVRGLVTRKFVKPVQQKLFSGFVYDPMIPRCRFKVANYDNDTLCFIADEIEFVSEYRCFVCRDELVGVKHYTGDPFVSLDKKTLDKALACCKGKMPAAFALDLGVSSTGETLLVEVTDGYALGGYGLPSVTYARFLEARWEQLVSHKVNHFYRSW